MRIRFLTMRYSSVFKKWANSNYAVFCSMGKIIKIGSLLVIYLHFANPGVASVQENDTLFRKIDLKPIDVSTTQQPETYSAANRVVVTIGKKEIERAAVSSVNELLEYASNIDIRQRGINGSQADVSIRGGSFDQVLILLNGININDPQSGHHNLNLPLDLTSVESIEILKGPAAWKFGPGAFTGAINFITSKASQNQANVSISAGQFKLHSEAVSSHLTSANTAHFLSINHSQSDGYIENTDYTINNLFYRGSIKNKAGQVSAQFGLSDKGFGSNSFYTPAYPNQYEATNTTFASLEMKSGGNWFSIESKMHFRRNHDRFELFRNSNNAPSWYSAHNYHTSDVLGINVVGVMNLIPNHSTTIGFDGRSESIWSNVLGELRSSPIESPKYEGVELDHSHHRSIWSAFVNHKFATNKFLANVALNMTRNSDQDLDLYLYPALDMSYSITNRSSIFGTVGKTMRFPTFTDLYYKSATNIGNASLKPEESFGSELGFKHNSLAISLSGSAFYRNGNHLIDWVKAPGETIWKSKNHTKLNTYGIDINGKINFQEIAGQTPFGTLSLAYTYMGQTKEQGDLISYYVMDYLKHRLDIGLEHRIWQDFSAHWHWSFQSRNGTYTQYRNGSYGEEVEYEPFSLFDLKIKWVHNGWIVYGSINNIFATQYFDIANVAQPGRWIKLGLSKTINW